MSPDYEVAQPTPSQLRIVNGGNGERPQFYTMRPTDNFEVAWPTN